MRATTTLLALSALRLAAASEPKPSFTPTNVKGVFVEQFGDDWDQRWSPSDATKKTPVGGETFSYVGKWAVEESTKLNAIDGDKGLVAKTIAAHHAISAPFSSVLDPSGKTLVVQYEVKFQKGGNCGGGYMKLLESGYQADGPYNDKTPWVIMFGPDLTCPGTKVHFIFRHQNPISKEWEEKHLQSPPTPIIEDASKLYTLIVNPDNTYEILVDGESSSKGSLLENFAPAVNPAAEIDDPEDSKPADWVDAAKIADPEATKPEDWDEDAPYSIPDEDAVKPEGWLEDEPAQIADPDAEKPEEWDDEEDGDWIAPTIPNPKCEEAPGCGEWVRPTKTNPAYKGKWTAPLIDNPAYKGVWAPRKIANPNFFEDKTPSNFNEIGGIGFELWTMTEDILFDNIYVGHSPEDAKALADETFFVKQAIEKAAKAAEKPAVEEKDVVEGGDWKTQILDTIRDRVLTFVDIARIDPVTAFKSQPETGAGLVVAALALLGSLGALLGVVGGSSKPVKSAKKSDGPSKSAAPTASTTATEKKEATKRK